MRRHPSPGTGDTAVGEARFPLKSCFRVEEGTFREQAAAMPGGGDGETDQGDLGGRERGGRV